jgi:hypothetical protein
VHVYLDGVWEGSVWGRQSEVEQLMMKSVGWGERETTVESDKDQIILEVKGREPEFEVCL